MQYAAGQTAFRYLTLDVDERVLIPRPETEHVVVAALEALGAGQARKSKSESPEANDEIGGSGPATDDGHLPPPIHNPKSKIQNPFVCDVGTGSGAIATPGSSGSRASTSAFRTAPTGWVVTQA